MMTNGPLGKGFTSLGTNEQPRCKHCGSLNTLQGPGAGPHYARLLCKDCGSFIKWVAKPKLPEINGATGGMFFPWEEPERSFS